MIPRCLALKVIFIRHTRKPQKYDRTHYTLIPPHNLFTHTTQHSYMDRVNTTQIEAHETKQEEAETESHLMYAMRTSMPVIISFVYDFRRNPYVHFVARDKVK